MIELQKNSKIYYLAPNRVNLPMIWEIKIVSSLKHNKGNSYWNCVKTLESFVENGCLWKEDLQLGLNNTFFLEFNRLEEFILNKFKKVQNVQQKIYN